MSFSNICLLCLQNSDGLFKIFGKRGIELNAGAILKVHFWFEVSETDEKSVCEKCWWTVHHFHVFYNSVKLNHQDQSIFDLKSVIIDSTEHNELPALLDAIKEEPSIDINNDLEECSSDIPYSPDVRESYDESERYHVTDYAANHTTDSPTITRRKRQIERTNDLEECPSDISNIPYFPDVRESYNESERHHVTDHAANHAIDANQTTDSPTITRSKRQTGRTTSVSPSINPKKFKTDSHTLLLSTYFKMACDLCDTLLSSYRDTKKHYKDAHNINKGYLICCSKKFFSFQHMLQHCQWHMNPDSFKCSFCQKCFADMISLRRHIRNVHSPETEREYQCEICKKSFAKSCLLRAHTKVNHVKDEDKQFECDICGMRFVILPFLKNHINKVHRNVHSHICELCAKPFKSGTAYEMHYVTIHTNISQKVQCDKCGKWSKNKASLKRHFLWHYSKTEKCGICGRVSSNSKALYAHIRLAHREASLECTICGKMFKKQKVLKEHMAIHAGIDLYTCTFCTKTFRSSANMYSHRKRAHPVELEQKKASLNCFTPATTV